MTQGYGPKNAKGKEIRALAAYPHSWGPGKVHAARYWRHPMWERGWFPICTDDHIHASEPSKVKRSQLGAVITCKRCLGKLDNMGAL
jgi:hypothetical protein